MDLLLDDTGDLDLSEDGLQLVDGNDAIEQHLLIRLRLVKGEWFLDERVGTPYYSRVLIKNPDLEAVRLVFRRVILTTPGILSLSSFSLTLDTTTRVASLSFTATKDDGATFVFAEEFIVP